MLAREGCSVIEAANGRLGLQQVERERPSLVVLDLMMPVMDGFEFIEALARTPAGGSIPLVVVTAKDLSESEARWLSGSVGRVLQKAGTRPDALLSHVREQIRASVQPAVVIA